MKKKLITLGVVFLMSVAIFAGCKGNNTEDNNSQTNASKTIKFADVGWDSIKFHNAVAMLIAEKVYGYKTEEVNATTPLTTLALKDNDIDVIMEMWTDNLATYKDDITTGAYIEHGTNFDDNMQGFYVPKYVIYGDKARTIEASAPDLKTVADLSKYKSVFVDEEDKSKGRIYGAISGWAIDGIMNKKYKFYGLDSDYNYFQPGSDAALTAAFASAYEKGEAIVGYYWDPTWLTGKYEFVLLEDAPYDANTFNDGKCACPAVDVTICSSNEMLTKAPDFITFLKKYKTSSALTAKALAYMQDKNANYADTAKWFLKNHDELLVQWLTPAEANIIREVIK